MGRTVGIIYEDKDILAVNKPSGLPVHPDGKTKEETLVDWILRERPDIRDVGEPLILSNARVILRPGVVHRLDKGTSGVLILAKHRSAHAHLKRQFQMRRAEKVYNAFLYGRLLSKEGIIDTPIGKSRKDFRLRAVGGTAGGVLRGAVTEYKVLKSAKECSYVEVYPKTGRMHQIRIHFKSIGHPVVCDKLYAPKRPCLLGFTRLALHARLLSIETPSGGRLILEAPLPSDFEEALKQLL
jgi:23S rRNA pseudouridine1911/1915/1917 synthase